VKEVLSFHNQGDHLYADCKQHKLYCLWRLKTFPDTGSRRV